ncbi:MAG: HAMP domain-containing protein [Rhizobacter sp.]|nr:HAMP domain-containing protein [Rhizobacter sp.]
MNFFHLDIRRKLLAMGLLGLAFVLTVGATGFVSTARLAASSDHLTNVGSALRYQLQADMAHDALRADVLAALLAGEKKDAEAQKAVKDDLAEHAGQFRESLKTLETLALDAEARAAVDKVRPALIAYVDSATAVVNLAFTDRAAAEARMGDFMKSFKSLEDEMEAVSDKIEAQAKRMQAESNATSRVARATIAVAVLLSMAALVVVGWWVARSIVAPIRRAVQIAETVAAGDLNSHIEAGGRDETGQLLNALKRMNDSLVKIVGTVRQSSDSIATGSSEISTGSLNLSQRTEEQASNLQQTAASMEQITATVRHNADTARQAAELAEATSQTAGQGGAAVDQVVSTMAEISAASEKINEITGVIDGIAFQTNILALNAAVEAARAGEQGRGFAVVAGEVRTLAQRSAVAAKEIKSLIQASVEKVEAGSRQAGAAGETMGAIVSQVRHVSQLISEISSATLQQTTGIGQVSDAVAQLDQVTQQNAALVEESAAAAESLKVQARQLVDVVAVFRVTA